MKTENHWPPMWPVIFRKEVYIEISRMKKEIVFIQF